MPSYWAMPFDKVCIGFKFNNVLKWAVIPYKASSLYDVIADGDYRPTSISKSTWMSLIDGGSLLSKCNQEGFNTGEELQVRLGIISNNGDNCINAGSFIGFGATRPISCGNSCHSYSCGKSSMNSKGSPVFGYIMIQ